ncbi:MAG: hypothetical protein A3G34_02470 [Candidatus Lindowbacteria bacterium RIFCSPLOWO2_12_FULL_62_27]|nr:MAG: hypothetical protein A3G34_02470 [Candidatus Lindowbacteria bacterium RIFCSPLOWO2_12_FULL_62_27]
MRLTKANDNKEEYKGLLKLFLQRNNFTPLVCLLAFGLVSLFILPANAVFFNYSSGSTGAYNTDSGTAIRSEGQSSAITPTPGSFGLTYYRANVKVAANTDTRYGVVGPADSSSPRVKAIYGDTLSVLSGPSTPNDTVVIAGTSDFDTVYLTADTAVSGDVLTYVLAVTNYGNAADTIGLIVDSAWTRGAGTDTSTGRFSYQFFDRTGAALTGILTLAHQDTAKVALKADTGVETASLKIYTAGASNADTVRMFVRAFANNGSGRAMATSGEVAPYVGLNGVKYGGSGNASTFFEVTVSGPLVRLAKFDTVFAPVSLGGATGAAVDDTQHYVPGAMLVYTIWFDNDGNDTADTIVIEDWIDTRHLRFDSAGLSQLRGVAQIAASGALADSFYGNIYADSRMPNIGGAVFSISIQYSSGGDSFAGLTEATPLESVGRLRWTIGRVGTRGVVGANNGDDVEAVDLPPVAAGAASDVDMGYVRFAVVIR